MIQLDQELEWFDGKHPRTPIIRIRLIITTTDRAGRRHAPDLESGQ